MISSDAFFAHCAPLLPLPEAIVVWDDIKKSVSDKKHKFNLCGLLFSAAIAKVGMRRCEEPKSFLNFHRREMIRESNIAYRMAELVGGKRESDVFMNFPSPRDWFASTFVYLAMLHSGAWKKHCGKAETNFLLITPAIHKALLIRLKHIFLLSPFPTHSLFTIMLPTTHRNIFFHVPDFNMRQQKQFLIVMVKHTYMK